ncbi:MAG: acyl esterase [Pseudonocardia sp. SCN 73-27]|uniref:CocE/NonD family hydrolase n=1 Tax=unclassified Pseudonocardia TaxID=2619320 RepID=UPI000869AFD5|nr:MULTISPECIES: CocE/NonD family hydrolase [unclassified Pseudonocardia]ODU29628.1 MAG: acyl esterase [Pseudonocardia sp. SCN 72-51]ODV00469.1 MAG: acyl esterase [Pseudonocardia sp. SCN 73-27]
MTSHLSIPLKGSTAGIQYAGWKPADVAMEGLGNRVLAGQRIPVDEGVTLNADVYTPSSPGRYPAVVSFGGYSTEWHTAGIPTGTNEIGSPPVFTDRGYCPVIVERRGMGRSTGEQVMFFDPQDVDDHEKVIAWAAEQPWCDGQVVLFGTSYYGMTQPLVAARKPPALTAFFGNELCTDFFRHLVQFGGVPASFFLAVWMGGNYTESNYTKRMSPTRRALISHLTNGPLHPLLEKMVHRNADRMFGSFMASTPVEWARQVYANWMFDEKTRDESTIPEGSTVVLGDIEVPFTVVQNLGYFNLHQFGSYDLFENAATPADRKWMILGPARFDLPVYAWQGEALAFFDHVLRDVDNGYDEQPPVRYWLEGADRFCTATAFPPPAAEKTVLYLGTGGDDHAIHRLDRQSPDPGSNSWVAVPFGVPVLGGLDEITNQTLTFDLPVVDNLHLAGPVTAQLSFSSNEIDSYVLARLTRVDAAGTLHPLSMGAIRPAARTEDVARSTTIEIAIDSGHREPLTPGEPVVLRFSLTPGPTHLSAGDTLRLELASRTDLLRSDVSEGYAQFDLPVPPYLSRNTVHYAGQSWIEVTSVPGTP